MFFIKHFVILAVVVGLVVGHKGHSREKGDRKGKYKDSSSSSSSSDDDRSRKYKDDGSRGHKDYSRGHDNGYQKQKAYHPPPKAYHPPPKVIQPIITVEAPKPSVADTDRGLCTGRFFCGATDKWSPAECLSHKLACDGKRDCFNGKDEHDCSVMCSVLGKMMCDDGLTCGKKCDGHWDCAGGEDEKWCPAGCKCKPGHYLCKNKEKCIPFSMLCNGENDCHDYDDENQCPLKCACGPGQYQCLDGSCISNTQLCDTKTDCKTGDDENECAPQCKCMAGDYICKGTGKCIPLSMLCDGEVDCEMVDDEMHRDEGGFCENRGRGGPTRRIVFADADPVPLRRIEDTVINDDGPALTIVGGDGTEEPTLMIVVEEPTLTIVPIVEDKK